MNYLDGTTAGTEASGVSLPGLPEAVQESKATV
jgi:hypothetical protein